MDRKSPTIPEIQRLIDLSADARACLTNDLDALRQRLNVPARIRRSLKDRPATWVVGSIASGIAASFAFRRYPSSPPKPRANSQKLLGFAWTAARPLVKIWLMDQLKTWVAGQVVASPASRFLSRFTPPTTSR